jgi:hypothetical protein
MKFSKSLRLLLIGTALALTSQVAQATVVNLSDRGVSSTNTDILCRVDGFDSWVENCWMAKDEGALSQDNNEVLNTFATKVSGFSKDNLLYKVDASTGTDQESLASAYETTFTADASGATISQVEGQASVDCSVSCFLLVKDGNHAPFAYLFLLSLGWDDRETHRNYPTPDNIGWATAGGGPSWDGIADLELRNFWSGEGEISYVALYSASVSAVPVPAAFWLFGTALMCFIGLSRSTRV